MNKNILAMSIIGVGLIGCANYQTPKENPKPETSNGKVLLINSTLYKIESSESTQKMSLKQAKDDYGLHWDQILKSGSVKFVGLSDFNNGLELSTVNISELGSSKKMSKTINKALSVETKNVSITNLGTNNIVCTQGQTDCNMSYLSNAVYLKDVVKTSSQSNLVLKPGNILTGFNFNIDTALKDLNSESFTGVVFSRKINSFFQESSGIQKFGVTQLGSNFTLQLGKNYLLSKAVSPKVNLDTPIETTYNVNGNYLFDIDVEVFSANYNYEVSGENKLDLPIKVFSSKDDLFIVFDRNYKKGVTFIATCDNKLVKTSISNNTLIIPLIDNICSKEVTLISSDKDLNITIRKK